MKNIADGMEPTTALIMSNNPFYYLEQSPAYANWFYPPDNATWRYNNYGYTRWYMFCPHYDATGALGSDAGSATKGKLYMYEGTYAGNHPAGTFWKYTDKGH